MVIAIDGPAGAGKSTVAKAVSKELNILYLDTGAMYRAAALYALGKGIDPAARGDVEASLSDIAITVGYSGGAQVTYLNGRDVSTEIRQNHVSKAASDISAHPSVRYKMVELQREIAKEADMVLDGRDIGTFVLPDADVKIFLTADDEERARRRTLELKEKGQDADFYAVLEDIRKRDYNDSHRDVAPLRQAEDAVAVDTTGVPVEEVIAHILDIVKSKCPARD